MPKARVVKQAIRSVERMVHSKEYEFAGENTDWIEGAVCMYQVRDTCSIEELKTCPFG